MASVEAQRMRRAWVEVRMKSSKSRVDERRCGEEIKKTTETKPYPKRLV